MYFVASLYNHSVCVCEALLFFPFLYISLISCENCCSCKYAAWKTMRRILSAECITNLICTWRSHVIVQESIAKGRSGPSQEGKKKVLRRSLEDLGKKAIAVK